MAWQDCFLIWGDEGLQLVGDDHPMPRTGPILGLAKHRNNLYALTSDSILILDQQLILQRRLDLHGHGLVVSGSTLAIVKDNNAEFFDLSMPEPPLSIGKLSVGRSVALHPAHQAGLRNSFYVQHDDGSGIMVRAIRGRVEERLRFNQRPWFSGAATTGRIISRIDDGSNTFTVFAVTDSRTGSL
jgi:hypothetical protein